MPEPKSRGQRRHRPPEDALLKQRQRRLAKALERAGHGETAEGGGSAATGPTAEGPGHATGPGEEDPWADALARVRGHMERARAFRAWIDAEPDRTAAALAKREGLTRARVPQVLKLTRLAPAIVADIEREDRRGPVPSELQLRRIAGIPEPAKQWACYRHLVEYGDLSMGGGNVGRRPSPRGRGFQHDLERARRFQDLWDTGAYDSLRELGRVEGITGARVSQLLNLLHLVPEILPVIDVSEEELPSGISKKEMRVIARLRGPEEQQAAFRARWPGILEAPKARPYCTSS